MRIFQVRILRMLLIGLIGLVSLAVAANYIHTRRQRRDIIKPAGQLLAPEMLRSAETLEYDSWESGVLKFRVRAAKLVETRQGKRLLQGISANSFDPDGSIRNEITSQNGDYDSDRKEIYFHGDVRLHLSNDVEIRMESLHYSIGAQLGTSDDSLQLLAPQVEGTAKGVRYDNARRDVELVSALSFVVHRPVNLPDGTRKIEDYYLKARQGLYSEQELLVRLLGNASVLSATGSLSGDRIDATFTPEKRHLTSLSSHGNAIYESKMDADTRSLRGDHLDFDIGKESQVLEGIHALGQAGFALRSPNVEQNLTAEEFHLMLDPVKGHPTRLEGQRGVRCSLDRANQKTEVSGEWLEAVFVPGETTLETMNIRNRASMKINIGPAAPDELQAEEIRISFKHVEGRSMPREFQAERAVQWKSPGRSASEPARTLMASSLVMRYASSGEFLESGTAGGNVSLTAAPRTGTTGTQLQRLQSDRADFYFFKANNRLQRLTGDGHVHVTYRSEAPGAKLPAEEFSTSSAAIRIQFREADGSVESVNQSGSFTYQDAARSAFSDTCDFSAATEKLVLTGNPSVQEIDYSASGEILEYDRKAKILTIRRKVRSVLKSGAGKTQGFMTASAATSSPVVVTAEELLFWKEQDKARYSGNVRMLSADSQLQAQSLLIQNQGETVDAEGEVRHYTSRFGDVGKGSPAKTAKSQPGKKEAKLRGSGPVDIRCARLHYSRAANLIHYEGDVSLDSDDAKIRSDVMDVYLHADNGSLDHARAYSNLRIKQAGRDIRGNEGEYFPSEGRLVVTGDAELADPIKGLRISGRRLTFYTTDDRIDVR